jgi:predicted adenylyl cyclase CyaB
MIEVEKKFKPNAEQLNAMTIDAEFLGEKVLRDVYYDYPDYRMFKKGTRLRNRNGDWELKLGRSGGVAEELETEEEIKNFLNIQIPLVDFINANMKPFIDYTTKRKKYKNGEFEICVDDLDFGLSVVEVELMVANEDDVTNAKEKIVEFGKSFGLDEASAIVKRTAYFQARRPDLYKELCEDN